MNLEKDEKRKKPSWIYQQVTALKYQILNSDTFIWKINEKPNLSKIFLQIYPRSK